jgi:hypothetical protein
MAAANQPTPQSPCVPFSISLAVLAPDNKRQVSFGVTKGCNADNTSFYLLHFVLRDKLPEGFQDRVVLDVRVNAQDNPLAEKLATEGLKRAQLDFLAGPVTNAAKRLPAGTMSDQRVEGRVRQVLTVS